jgi:hypothetical protein
MQQGTSVAKNFAWCAARTPLRRAPEDTLAHIKTLPLGAWMMPKLGMPIFCATHMPCILLTEMHPVDTPLRPRYGGVSSASSHRALPSCRG